MNYEVICGAQCVSLCIIVYHVAMLLPSRKRYSAQRSVASPPSVKLKSNPGVAGHASIATIHCMAEAKYP